MTDSEKPSSATWYVYLVRTAAGVLYTGISTDTARRVREHEKGAKGSRILRGRGPLELVFQIEAGTRSSASKLEARIKKLNRKQKLELVSGRVECRVINGWLPVVM